MSWIKARRCTTRRRNRFATLMGNNASRPGGLRAFVRCDSSGELLRVTVDSNPRYSTNTSTQAFARFTRTFECAIDASAPDSQRACDMGDLLTFLKEANSIFRPSYITSGDVTAGSAFGWQSADFGAAWLLPPETRPDSSSSAVTTG
jgi:hypothetical protein